MRGVHFALAKMHFYLILVSCLFQNLLVPAFVSEMTETAGRAGLAASTVPAVPAVPAVPTVPAGTKNFDMRPKNILRAPVEQFCACLKNISRARRTFCE